MKQIKTGRIRRGVLQNVCILCLSVLAAVLLAAVFSYESDSGGPIPALNSLLGASSGAGGAQSTDLVGMAAPFNLVATTQQGRYGRMLVDSGESGPLHSSNLLLEALGSAGGGVPVEEERFRAALEGTSLFLDYLAPIPAAVLAGWFGVSFSAQSDVRYVLISAQDGAVWLYLHSGADHISRYATAVEDTALEDLTLALSASFSDVAFAFEDPEHYGHLAPYTVLSSDAAESSILSASLPALASDVDTLLSMLDFNPHTIARYNLSDGIEVVEFPRTFRVYHDGVIQYSGDTDAASPLYVIPAAGETPTQAEAVLAARRLAEVLLPEEVLLGTDVYFSGIRATEKGYAITFDYLVDGIPIFGSSGDPALEIETTGAVITAFRLQYRQYIPGEETYHLLPLAQAVHMASAYSSAFLTQGYVDRGGETVLAQWLIR